MKRLHKKRLLTFLLAINGSLLGCVSEPIKRESQSKHTDNPAAAQDVKHQQVEQSSKTNVAGLKNLPGWVSEQPTTDTSGFYGVGVGSDRDLLGSMQQAKQDAVKQLAHTIKVELGGNGADQSAINHFVDQLDLSNAQVVKQKVQPSNGLYQSYVLTKYSYKDFARKLKQSRQSEDDQQTLEDAYHRLMKKIGRE